MVSFSSRENKVSSEKLLQVLSFEPTIDLADFPDGVVQSQERIPLCPLFVSGVFVVGETGKVSIDILFDSGFDEGELAIFSLEGMEELEVGSEAFILEAAKRSVSDSHLGHIAIPYIPEKKLSSCWEEKENNLEVQTLAMRPGDTFSIMLVSRGKVEQILVNTPSGEALSTIFSVRTTNSQACFIWEPIADLTGEGHTFIMEDRAIDVRTDRDYNEIIFRLQGARGNAVQLHEETNRDWCGFIWGDDKETKKTALFPKR